MDRSEREDMYEVMAPLILDETLGHFEVLLLRYNEDFTWQTTYLIRALKPLE